MQVSDFEFRFGMQPDEILWRSNTRSIPRMPAETVRRFVEFDGLNPKIETLAIGTPCRERNCEWQGDEWDGSPRHSARWRWSG